MYLNVTNIRRVQLNLLTLPLIHVHVAHSSCPTWNLRKQSPTHRPTPQVEHQVLILLFLKVLFLSAHTAHFRLLPSGWCLCISVGYGVLLVNGWWMIFDLYACCLPGSYQLTRSRYLVETWHDWFSFVQWMCFCSRYMHSLKVYKNE